MTSTKLRHREIVLVGDIGGSTARFATARVTPDHIELGDVASLKCADYPGFEQAVEHYLGRPRGARPLRAVIAIAAAQPNGEQERPTSHNQ